MCCPKRARCASCLCRPTRRRRPLSQQGPGPALRRARALRPDGLVCPRQLRSARALRAVRLGAIHASVLEGVLPTVDASVLVLDPVLPVLVVPAPGEAEVLWPAVPAGDWLLAPRAGATPRGGTPA